MELHTFPSSCTALSLPDERRSHGFTLVELLIVIAIIGILTATVVPNLMASRGTARDRAAQTHAKNVFTAGFAYVSEDSDNLVVVGDCATGYAAGSYTLSAPGSAAVRTCTVSDDDGDGIPEVVVETPAGTTISYP